MEDGFVLGYLLPSSSLLFSKKEVIIPNLKN